MNGPVHWQLPDRSLACGADHHDARAYPVDDLCCNRDPGWVTCDACAQIARLTGAAA